MNIYLHHKVKVFVSKNQTSRIQSLNFFTVMYEISSSLYLEIAERLADALRSKSFFSGVVTLYDGDVECRLCCTLIISRSNENEPSGVERITSIVPVWWELKTALFDEPMDNDFSFNTMLTYLL